MSAFWQCTGEYLQSTVLLVSEAARTVDSSIVGFTVEWPADSVPVPAKTVVPGSEGWWRRSVGRRAWRCPSARRGCDRRPNPRREGLCGEGPGIDDGVAVSSELEVVWQKPPEAVFQRGRRCVKLRGVLMHHSKTPFLGDGGCGNRTVKALTAFRLKTSFQPRISLPALGATRRCDANSRGAPRRGSTEISPVS